MNSYQYFLHIAYSHDYITTFKKQMHFITDDIPRRALNGGIIRQHLNELPIREFIRSPRTFDDMVDRKTIFNIIPLYTNGIRTGIGYVPNSLVPHPNRYLNSNIVDRKFSKRGRQTISINTNEFDMILDVIAHTFGGVKSKTFDDINYHHIIYAFEDYYPPLYRVTFSPQNNAINEINIPKTFLKIEYRIKRFLKELPQNVVVQVVYKTGFSEVKEYIIFPQNRFDPQITLPIENLLPRDKKILHYAEQNRQMFQLRHEIGPIKSFLQNILSIRMLRKMQLDLYNPDKLSPVPTASYTFYVIENNEYLKFTGHSDVTSFSKNIRQNQVNELKKFAKSFQGVMTEQYNFYNTNLRFYKIDFHNANVMENLMDQIIKYFPKDFRIMRVTTPLQYVSDNTCGEFQIYPFSITCSKSKTIRPAYDFILRDMLEKYHQR